MPILYNFHILLASFYTIFWDYHIDPVPSASSYLLHVLCFAKTPYQTESKRDKNGRRIFLEYLENMGRKIHARRFSRGARGRGRAPPPGRAFDPCGALVTRLLLFFCRKKANFQEKILVKVSVQSELRMSIYIRNSERAARESAETERDRETDPI